MTSEAFMSTLKHLRFKILHVPPCQNMCHILWYMRLTLCLYQGPFPDHVHHEPAQGSPIASATFVPALKKSKPHTQKKSRNNLSSHDRGLQRCCLSPWRPTDQTQIKCSKINLLLIMRVLQFVTGIASGKQASWLHMSRHPTWIAEIFLVWREFVVLCDHPPEVK